MWLFKKKVQDNLKIYPDYNHSFEKPAQNKEDDWSSEFMKVFEDFMKWVEE